MTTVLRNIAGTLLSIGLLCGGIIGQFIKVDTCIIAMFKVATMGVDEETEIPKHKLDKHNKQPKKDDPAIICQNCKKVFGQKARYKLHIQICGKPDARPFQCQHCEKKFLRQGPISYPQ